MTAHAAAAREHAVVIGLEVHVQLETDTKIFCGCGTDFEDDKPNSHTCPTCLGLPGALPVLNEAAVDAGLKLAAAIDADVPETTRFHRKNYYYPDLPKNFQITQYDSPLCENGELTVAIEDDERTIAIERAHLEEDPGSLQHAGGGGGIDTAEYTRVDYNRAGVPLMEIVTEPDFRGPDEVRAFLAKLTEVLEYLDVFDSSRDGSLRVDANISLVPDEDVDTDGTIGAEALAEANRTEVKNISSHKGAEKALAYEVTRQRNALQRDRTIEQETRHWDESRGVTVSMRSKEEEKDYRYFAEPDLPVLQVADRAEAIEIPELPDARRERFREEYGLSPAAARKLTSTRAVADFYERVADQFDPDAAASWVADSLLGELNYRDMQIADVEDRLDEFVRLVELAETSEITEKNAEEVVLRAMLDEGLAPDDVIEREGLGTMDEDELREIVKDVIKRTPDAVTDYYRGQETAVNSLVGQVMSETKGSADPNAVNNILRERLHSKFVSLGRTEWDDIDWRTYQKIVAGLEGLSGDDVEVKHEYTYPLGDDGKKEVDVVVQNQSRHHTFTTLIECKFYDRTISQDVVDSMVGVLSRSDADKGIVIGKSGFQSGAIERARGSGVELWTLRQIDPEIDLKDTIQTLNLNLEIKEPKLNVLDMDVRALGEEQEGKEMELNLTQRNSMLYTSAREPTGETLLDRLNELLNSKEEGEHTETFEAKLLLLEGEFYALNSISYEIKYSVGSVEQTMDLLESADLIFIDELSEERKFVSLYEALESFVDNVE